VLTATNKQLLIYESRDDSNRCTSCRVKPDQHVTRITRSVHVWSQIIRISCGQHIATFHIVINSSGQRHRSQRKSAPDTIHNMPTERSMDMYPISLPRQTPKRGGKATLYWRQATRLLRPISPACDRYFQYLLTGANPLVLNRHRWRLQPPKNPAQSQVFQSQYSLKGNGDMKHLSPTHGLSTTRHLPKSISTSSNC
jgi:hypothetical protein